MLAFQLMRFMFFEILFAASFVYAVIRGGAPERITALLFVAAWFLTFAAESSAHIRYTHVEIGVFFVDLGLFAAVYVLSLFSTRFWPIWMSGLLGVEVLVHGTIFVSSVSSFAYAVMEQFWGYPTLVLLIVATRRHRLRLARTGSDRPWIFPAGRREPPSPD